MRTLVNKIKLIWNKILNIFNKSYMKFEFQTIPVEEVEKKINLKQRAEKDGTNNIPPADSLARSNCEEEAITEFDNRRHEQVLKAVKYLDPIKHKITGYTSKLTQTHFFIQGFKEKTEKTLGTAISRLSNLRDIFDRQNKELKDFKLSNDLTRDPVPLTMNKIIIGILFVLGLFYIEVEVNRSLLAPALMGGEQEASGIVFSVAALNVFISFLAGYFLVKNFHLKRGVKKIASKIILSLYGIFIVYLNWCLGAFRAIAEQKGQVAAWGQSEATISDVSDLGNAVLPWTVDFSFYAVVLTFVGLSFALFSLLDGYFFDDPYPGYGKVGKGRNENKNEINRIRESLITEINTLFRLENKRVEEQRGLLINDTKKQWSINITILESAFASYIKFAKKISEDTNHIIMEYISINNIFRTEPKPKYWLSDGDKLNKVQYKLDVEKLDPKQVFPDLAQLYLDNKQIETQSTNFHNKITEEVNNYQKEVNQYKEEVSKKVEQIRGDYKVDQN